MDFSIPEIPDELNDNYINDFLEEDAQMNSFHNNNGQYSSDVITINSLTPEKRSSSAIWIVTPENIKKRPASILSSSLELSPGGTVWTVSDRNAKKSRIDNTDNSKLSLSQQGSSLCNVISSDGSSIKESTSHIDDSKEFSLKKPKSVKGSLIWNHFTIDKKNKIFATCNYCNKSYKHSGNTTNLMTHLKCKHPEKLSPSKDQKKVSKSKGKSGTLDNLVEKMNSYKDGGSLAANVTNEILRMIVKCKMPIMTVNKPGFRRLIKFFAPHYTIPDRKTFKTLIHKKYNILKQQLISKKINNALSYCVTCDNWTDKKSQTYLGVTLHYLSSSLKVENINIGVFPMDTNHSADNLAESLNQVLNEFEIEKNKILSIITDSASNIKACIEKVVGSSKWVGCFAHTLSHLVPDVFVIKKKQKTKETDEEDDIESDSNKNKNNTNKANITESKKIKQQEEHIEVIKETIAKVRKICSKIRRSTNASAFLKQKQIDAGLKEGECLRFKMDMEVRWNSTLFMIERYLKLHDYVYGAIKEMLPSNKPPQLSAMELDIINDIVPMMKMVEWGISSISGESYTTASMVIPIVRIMKSEVNKHKPETEYGETFKIKLLEAIHKRCDKLEEKVPLIMATFLDPRFKKFFFEHAMTVVTVKRIVSSMIDKNSKKTDEKTNVEPILESNLWSKHKDFLSGNTKKSSSDTLSNSEVEGYLRLRCLDFKDDPMEGWQLLKTTFPTLYDIAIRYISTLGSSVPSERLFSVAGKLICDDRNRLLGNYLNELLFLSSLPDEDWF